MSQAITHGRFNEVLLRVLMEHRHLHGDVRVAHVDRRVAEPSRSFSVLHLLHQIVETSRLRHRFVRRRFVVVDVRLLVVLVVVEAAEVNVVPEGQVADVVGGPQHFLAVRLVQRILVDRGGHERPDGERAVRDGILQSLLHRVAQKRSEQTRVDVLGELYQVAHGEFEAARELAVDLMDAVDPLEKHGAALVGLLRADALSTSVPKLVSEAQPFLLDQHAEAVDGPVERIEAQLGRRADLRRSVPAVAAVHQHRSVVPFDCVTDDDGSRQQSRHVLQPKRSLQQAVPVGDVGRRGTEKAQRVERLSYRVDVAQVHELNLRARVVLGALHAAAARSVGDGGRVGSGINDQNLLRLVNVDVLGLGRV